MSPKSPSTDVDLFTEEAIADPYPLYKQIRDAGAMVWLDRYDMWAISRFDDVQAALRADSVLLSGKGVSMNDALNGPTDTPNTLVSDGETHRRFRSPVIKPMLPGAMRDLRADMAARADELVDRLLQVESFDGMTDFSEHLPVEVVAVLIGLPEDARGRMLDWARASFDALGPMNDRCQAAMPTLIDAAGYMFSLAREALPASGWAASLYEAADDGTLDVTEAQRLVFDFVIPSLDTTILGTGHMLYQLGRNPEQFAKLKADPSLIPSAVNEALRIGTPVRAFSRLAETNYEADDVLIAAGERAVILYGAANHDERHYADPESFDITRNPKDHVAFGFGAHRCAGAHLAQLEMECLLDAMVRKVSAIEVGETKPFISNMLSGYSSFTTSFS